MITGDEARLLQPLHPHEARAWRKMNGFGEFHIGDSPVFLQLRQDLDIDTVETMQRGNPDTFQLRHTSEGTRF